MSKRRALAAVVCAWLGVWALWAQTRGLPPGPMKGKASAACLGCHDARIIVQQRLDRRGWTKVLDKMIRWGAPVSQADRDAMIAYFAEHFGPQDSEASHRTLAEGTAASKVRAACLNCHDADLIVQQRLDRLGWIEVVDRMVRWGAVVRSEDRGAIVDYLATNYAVRAKADREVK